MTTKASVIINFFDDPEYCHNDNFTELCNYLIHGFCALRVANPKELSVAKFLKLKVAEGKFKKCPDCKFIWLKENRQNG